MADLSVVWREGGHRLSSGDDPLHFDVIDINRVIVKSAADSLLYRAIQDFRGHPPNWQVLPFSCFAITGVWTPARLAAGTRFRAYRTVHASTFYDAGHEVWPTATSRTTWPTRATRSTTTSSWRRARPCPGGRAALSVQGRPAGGASPPAAHVRGHPGTNGRRAGARRSSGRA